GYVHEAQKIFDDIVWKNVFTWTVLMKGYADFGEFERSVALFREMLARGEPANEYTFSCALTCLGALRMLEQGRVVDGIAREMSFSSRITAGNALISMYGKCGSIPDAKNVFDSMQERNVVTWNALIAAYAQNGSIDDARDVFKSIGKRNLVSWNAMIFALVQHQKFEEVLDAYRQLQLDGEKADRISFIGVLDGCAMLEDLVEGKKAHRHVLEKGLSKDRMIRNALVNMYGRCSRVEKARQVFEKIEEKDIVSWNALASAAARHQLHDECGNVEAAKEVFSSIRGRDDIPWTAMMSASVGNTVETLRLLQEMDLEGVKPSSIAYAVLLDAFTGPFALGDGERIHARISESWLHKNALLSISLVNMYARCGCLEQARKVFEQQGDDLDIKTQVSWSSMISAYARRGLSDEALELLGSMIQLGLDPDGVTFISLLSGCSYGGLVGEACQCFYSLEHDHGLKPGVEHHRIIVDVLGRAGWLDEAEKMAGMASDEKNIEGGTGAWTSLLSSCRNFGDSERGARAAAAASQREPGRPSSYLILSSIY
ncbi:hypothetical protein SELMODRAFT_52147, partial [Selaginella moellendorffii]